MLALVFGEVWDGKVEAVTLEAIGAARKVANDVFIAILGSDLTETAEELAYYADRVYRVDGEEFKEFHPELWLRVLEEVCRSVKPEVIIFPHTITGADLAPILAFRLETQLTTDCINLEVEDGLLLRHKPVFGGNAVAVMRCEQMPQMVTVRPGSFEHAKRRSRKGEVIKLHLEVSEERIKLLKVVKEEIPRLDKADAIVSGGRGLGDRDGFDLLRKLAEELRALGFRKVEIGASRPAVDAGWIEKYRQVGLTGAKVSPELYVAVGISGAMQHIAGITRAKRVVAINTDPKAPIFGFANYGVVGDYRKVIPALIRKLRELRGLRGERGENRSLRQADPRS